MKKILILLTLVFFLTCEFACLAEMEENPHTPDKHDLKVVKHIEKHKKTKHHHHHHHETKLPA